MEQVQIDLEELDMQEKNIKIDNKILKGKKRKYRRAVERMVLLQFSWVLVTSFYYWLEGIDFFFIFSLILFPGAAIEYRDRLDKYFEIKEWVDKTTMINNYSLQMIKELKHKVTSDEVCKSS